MKVSMIIYHLIQIVRLRTIVSTMARVIVLMTEVPTSVSHEGVTR